LVVPFGFNLRTQNAIGFNELGGMRRQSKLLFEGTFVISPSHNLEI
jgi:hypothetical protein